MIKILKFILFLFVINSYGQELNPEYCLLKKNLLESKTDLIIEFKTDCIGGEFISIEEAEDCVYEKPFYIFWLKNKEYYKRKFSNCKIFPESKMEESEFIDTVKKNLNEIEKAEILPVVHETKNSDGEIESTELTFDHYCESTFIIHTSNKKITKNVIDFYLKTAFVGENMPNKNYLKNKTSILNTIFELAEKETK